MDKEKEEVVKKKRGRPPKNKETKNEKVEQIKMTSNSDTNYTIEDIQNKWYRVLNKYGGELDVKTVKNAYDRAIALQNPFLQNTRIKQVTSKATNKEKKDIQNALTNPVNNEQPLREMSMSLYYSNYVYNNLLRLNREIPQYYWYATPQYVDKKQMAQDNFKEEMKFVNKIVEKFNPALSFKTINMQVQLEGKTTYLVRKSYEKKKKVNFFLLQKLNSDEVKLTGFGSKQTYITSFNMMLFLNPMYDVSLYPPYIQEIWEAMQESGMIQKDENTGIMKFIPNKTLNPSHILEYVDGTYFYWVQLNQDDCFTFGQDLATPVCFPETAGLFLDLKELADYRWLMGNLMAKSVTTILTGEVPLQSDAKAGSDATIVSPDLIAFYDTIFNQTVSSNVMTYFAPFKNFELHNIDNQPDNMNIVYSRLRDLIATSGNSALMSISDKPSIAMTKASQAIAASRARYLTLQFEQFLNNVINNQFELEHQYKITIWGDIFNSDELKIAKELLQNGVRSLLPKVLSSVNLTIEDHRCVCDYLDATGIEIYYKYNNQGNVTEQEQKTTEEKKVGKPKMEIEEIENDSTAASVDAGNNVSDIKEF